MEKVANLKVNLNNNIKKPNNNSNNIYKNRRSSNNNSNWKIRLIKWNKSQMNKKKKAEA